MAITSTVSSALRVPKRDTKGYDSGKMCFLSVGCESGNYLVLVHSNEYNSKITQLNYMFNIFSLLFKKLSETLAFV